MFDIRQILINYIKNHNLSTMFEEVLKHYDLKSKIITIDIDSKINIHVINN